MWTPSIDDILILNGRTRTSLTAATELQSAGVAKWRHDQHEVAEYYFPQHVISLLQTPGPIERRRGRHLERIHNRRVNLALLPAGPTGAWTYGNPAPIEVTHIYLPPVYLDELAAQEGYRGGAIFPDKLACDDKTLLALAQQVDAALDQPYVSRLYLDGLVTAAAGWILQSGFQRPSNSTQAGLAPWQLGRAMDIIESTLDRDVSLAGIAREVGLSRFHFLRAFKAATGLPPHRYQSQLRLARAKMLLRTTTLSIGEIASQVGYNDQGHFARRFRQHAGVSPTRFRHETSGRIRREPGSDPSI